MLCDAGGKQSVATLLQVVIPFLTVAVLNVVEALCKHPSVAAVALACFSFIKPSFLSAGPSPLSSHPSATLRVPHCSMLSFMWQNHFTFGFHGASVRRCA